MDFLRQINIFATMLIAAFGLIGHFFIVLIYSHKKFCKNSAHVYIMWMAVCDALFIIVHLFEVNYTYFKLIKHNEMK